MIAINVYLYSYSVMKQDPTMLHAPQAETKKNTLSAAQSLQSRDGQK